jgi:hypothetical protein
MEEDRMTDDGDKGPKTVSFTVPSIPSWALQGLAGLTLLIVGVVIGAVAFPGEQVPSDSQSGVAEVSSTSSSGDFSEPEQTLGQTIGAGDCEEQGITPEDRKEGTCIENGIETVVVNRNSMLRLDELNAKLLGIEVNESISDEFGEVAVADGAFVTFTLSVTNKLSSPALFDSYQGQVSLLTGPGTYTQDFDVQNGFVEDSFLWNGEEIQPSGTQTGSVTFDIPGKIIPKIERDGNLQIRNFSEEGEENPSQLGVIRTYEE